MDINVTEVIENVLDRSKWVKWKFSDLVENIVDKVVPKDSGLDHYIGLKHLDTGSLKIRRFGETESLIGDKLKIYKGNLIFAKRNSYLKRVAIAEFDAVASAHALVLRPNSENVNPDFLPFFMMSEKFWQRAIEISVGSLSPTINWKVLAKQEFLLPPKDQQAQLAKLLWAMDEVIEKEKEVLRSVEQSYLVKIEKELLNKNSEKTYFKDLGKIIRGVGYKPNDLLDSYTNDTCVILRSNNIFESKINYDDIKILNLQKVKPSQILNTGDFAICMSNGSKDLVGKSAIYFDEGENVSIGSFCAGFRPKNNLSQRTVQHLFASNSYRYGIKRILSGSAINNLKPSDIESLFLRIEEDKTKVDILLNELDSLVKNISILEAKISVSQVLQKSIINQIF